MLRRPRPRPRGLHSPRSAALHFVQQTSSALRNTYYLIIIFLYYTHQHKFMHHHFHIKDISSNKSTLLRTLIFTFGHYWIDVLSNHFITGASIKSAMVASVAGPILNAIWYYVLDRMFFNYILSKHK